MIIRKLCMKIKRQKKQTYPPVEPVTLVQLANKLNVVSYIDCTTLKSVWFCDQLALERKKVRNTELASTTEKKKRKKQKEVTSTKSDVIGSAKRGAADDSTETEAEFVPHDYVKQNLTTLLQGTLVLSWKKCPSQEL